MKALLFLSLSLFSLGVSAQSRMVVKVTFAFGGVPLRSESPTAGSRLGVMVNYVSSPTGERRVQFIRNQTGVPSLQVEAAAQVDLRDDGPVSFVFDEPVPYEYLVTNEATGETRKVEGWIKSVKAEISPRNREQFARLLIEAPFSAYIDAGERGRIAELARIYKTEPLTTLSHPSLSEHVPGFALESRAGYAPYLDRGLAEVPRIRYPLNVPLEIKLDPLENKPESARVNGSPDLSAVVAITPEMVGLNGVGGYGGPDGFAPIANLTTVDLQDVEMHDFVAARAEVLRMQRRFMSEYRRRRGLPDLVVSERTIMLVTGGKGNDENYDGFSDVETCVSLLTGERLR